MYKITIKRIYHTRWDEQEGSKGKKPVLFKRKGDLRNHNRSSLRSLLKEAGGHRRRSFFSGCNPFRRVHRAF